MADFPVLQRHLGVWEGIYTLLDTHGQQLDHHNCRLEISRDGDNYFQRNIYTWADGKVQVLDFPGELRDGKLLFDTPRLSGYAVESGDRVIVLTWTYKENPNQHLAELIYLVDDTHRCRTWQFIENGELVRVMAITEHKVA